MLKENVLKELLDVYVEEFLVSPSNTYVVFDGTSEILYENDLMHCCAFIHELRDVQHTGIPYSIYSKEAYNEMKKSWA